MLTRPAPAAARRGLPPSWDEAAEEAVREGPGAKPDGGEESGIGAVMLV
jgi:hypothetical protein